MKRCLILSVVLLGISLQLSAYEKRDLLGKIATEEQVKNALVMNQAWLPYPKSYTNRADWDAFLGNFKNELIKQGENLLDYEWKIIKATYYLEHDRSGNRSIMETPYQENFTSLNKLFMAEMAEGKGRFTDQIINGVFQMCEMSSWLVSNHIAYHSQSKTALPDSREYLMDIFGGNTAQLMAWIYYYLHSEFDKVNPVISNRLRYEIQVREMNPYLNIDNLGWMGLKLKSPETQNVNNHNPWCNVSALLCFMLLENDRETLAKAVYKSMLSVDKYIDWVTADGACEEGPSYWYHGPGMLLSYLNALYLITGGKVSIFDNKLIRDMGEYIVRSDVGNGWVFNFADASALYKHTGDYDPVTVYRYGEAINSDIMKAFGANRTTLYPKGIDWTFPYHVFEMIRTMPAIEKQDKNFKAPDYVWYPATQFYMSRCGDLLLAAKGGHNDESHNHNDIGTFCFYINTTPIFIDAGVETYTRQTFSRDDRYKIWTMQSQYHNLPTINGVQEEYGRQYRPSDVKAAPLSLSMDIAGSFPDAAKVKSWVRSYKLNKKELKIQDKFTLKETLTPNIINFLIWGNVDMSQKGKIKIEVKGEKSVLTYDKNMFEAEKETVRLTDPRVANDWGSEIYRIKLVARKMSLNGTYSYTISKN